MTDLSKAIAAKQAQLTQLQADLDALQRATSVIGGKSTAKKHNVGASYPQLLERSCPRN